MTTQPPGFSATARFILPLAAAFVAGFSLLRAEESRDSTEPVRAHIPGGIPDGSPPPPAPPKPVWRVAPEDVVSENEQSQGGRRVIVREIKPIDLPPPPAPAKPVEINGELFRERAEAFEERNPKHVLMCVGATVYKSATRPARTHVRVWN